MTKKRRDHGHYKNWPKGGGSYPKGGFGPWKSHWKNGMKAVKPWNTTTPFWPPQKVVEILELRGGFNFLKSIPCVEHPIQGFKGSSDSSGKKHPLSVSGQITIHPRNQHGTWKWSPRRGDSYDKPSFLGSVLVFGAVIPKPKSRGF